MLLPFYKKLDFQRYIDLNKQAISCSAFSNGIRNGQQGHNALYLPENERLYSVIGDFMLGRRMTAGVSPMWMRLILIRKKILGHSGGPTPTIVPRL
jgi:hypothetical protein